jgi:hypothetical protein
MFWDALPPLRYSVPRTPHIPSLLVHLPKEVRFVLFVISALPFSQVVASWNEYKVIGNGKTKTSIPVGEKCSPCVNTVIVGFPLMGWQPCCALKHTCTPEGKRFSKEFDKAREAQIKQQPRAFGKKAMVHATTSMGIRVWNEGTLYTSSNFTAAIKVPPGGKGLGMTLVAIHNEEGTLESHVFIRDDNTHWQEYLKEHNIVISGGKRCATYYDTANALVEVLMDPSTQIAKEQAPSILFCATGLQ